VIPIFLLVWTLVVEHWQPGRSAMLAVGATLAVAVFNRFTRPSLHGVWVAVRETGQTVLELVIITALAGMIIGAIQISTLGFNFSLLLTQAAGENSLLLLVMTALVCIVLGMGMPSGVIYLMLALLIAPALVETGIPRLAASPVSFSCSLYQTLEIGKSRQLLVFGEIRRVHLSDDVASVGPDGRVRVDAARVNPVGRLGAGEYMLKGEILRLKRPA